MGTLNTHSPMSLDEVFPPAEAKRLVDKLEIHYMPRHGSWLNINEIELTVLSRQCLDRWVITATTFIQDWAGSEPRQGRTGRHSSATALVRQPGHP